MEKNRLPIGIQTFAEIRNEDMIYVDKTDLVYQLAHGTKYNFLSRPRRFGKSLLLSTLQCYFEGRKELFAGLAIEKLEKDWSSYPVIRIDMNNGLYQEEDGLENILNYRLGLYENALDIDPKDNNLASRFAHIIRELAIASGKGVVILIDEYEKPVLETIGYPALQQRHISLLKSFYSTLKSCDEYIRFAMMTGVTKMGHLSVFSGLNNVNNLSLDPSMAAICGFTKDQIWQYFAPYIEKIADKYGTDTANAIDLLKQKYDGYRFSEEEIKVFNPYSLLNAFYKNKLGNFWFETGTPGFLVNLLRSRQFKLSELDGVNVVSEYLTEIDDNYSSPIPLLYQSGYLTIQDYNESEDEYTIGYPNDEVRHGFLNSLIPNYVSMSGVETRNEIKKIAKSANEGNVEEFLHPIEILISSIPASPREAYEYLYRDSVYLIFKLLGFTTHSEVSMLSGRIDCVVETTDYVYILEFKANKSAKEALDQINIKGYANPYANCGRTIYKIGINFDTNLREITYAIETP